MSRGPKRRAKRSKKPQAEATAPRPRPFVRFLGSLLKLASGIAIVVGTATALTWGLYRYAKTTPRFAINQIPVEGSHRLTDVQVAKLGGVSLGQNVFSVDTEAIERRLLASPWIRRATVVRRLPGELRIELEERQAAAIATLADRLYLVTREGEPFKQIGEGDPFDLPVVTGVDLEQLVRDRPREIRRIGVAMEVLRHYERMPLARVHAAQEVHLGDDGSVTVTVGKEGVVLHLGHGPWKKKLLMAARVVGLTQKRGQSPGIVFLDNRAHPERVVVRMR